MTDDERPPADPPPIDRLPHGGGLAAIRYTFKKASEAGGATKLYRALRNKNACKACALGMGGQQGGMVDESNQKLEVCKKSIQAMVADMQPPVGEELFRTHSIEALKSRTPRELEHLGRLTRPLLRREGGSHYESVSWDEALDFASSRLRTTDPERSFFYFSGRSSNEAGFLLQLLARVHGTNHVNNCSYYCHQASGVGLSSVTGSGTASIVLEDLDLCDLLLVIGANPSSNHPRFLKTMLNVRRRGGKVVVINPLEEVGLKRFRIPSDPRSMLFSPEVSDAYYQPQIGGDLSLLLLLSKKILESGREDRQFLSEATEGTEEWMAHVRSLDEEKLLAQSGLKSEEVSEILETLVASKRTVFCWAMGVTHQVQGVETVQAISNLAMLLGQVGKEGAGLLPLRGHSNVQGIGSMGVTPQLKRAIFDALQQKRGLTLPTSEGLDTLACIDRAQEDGIDLALCLGGNLYGANPDSQYAASALAKVGLTIYLSTTLNSGHFAGAGKESLILPVLARDEEAELTTQESMFSFVRVSSGGEQRLEGPRSEVAIISELGKRRFAGEERGVDFEALGSHAELRAWIADVVPGYQSIAQVDADQSEFQVEGRTFHTPRFATASGKARFVCVTPRPLAPLSENELRLMTIRSEGQFNTVVYEEEDVYRGQERRDVILMNPSDVERLGLRKNDKIRVRSDAGEMHDILVRPFNISAGCAAMYYPESNVLVPRKIDDASKTPAFKDVRVAIETQGA